MPILPSFQSLRSLYKEKDTTDFHMFAFWSLTESRENLSCEACKFTKDLNAFSPTAFLALSLIDP